MKRDIFVDPFWTDAFSYWFMGHEVIFRFSFQVIYNVDGFIDKNNDLLFKDMSKAMFGCEHLFLKEMFPEGMNLISFLCQLLLLVPNFIVQVKQN